MASQQLPHPRCHGPLPRVRPGLVHRRAVRLRGPVHGQEAQRRHHGRGVQQLTEIGAGQRRLADGGGVAAHEGQGVGGVERERRQRPALPRPLTQQAQPDAGQRDQVAGADGADHPHRRGEAEVQRLGQHPQHGGVHPGSARRELVQPDHQQRPGPDHVEQRPGAAGVAAQQPQPVAGVRGGHRPVRAHPRGAAVHRPFRGHPDHHLPGQPGPLQAAGMHVHRGAVPGHLPHPLAGQRDAVDSDGWDWRCARHDGSSPTRK